MSGEEAWNRLAVKYKPVGYWDIPSSNITFLAFGGPVKSAPDAYGNDRPGGQTNGIRPARASQRLALGVDRTLVRVTDR
jgi:hypothetical protein